MRPPLFQGRKLTLLKKITFAIKAQAKMACIGTRCFRRPDNFRSCKKFRPTQPKQASKSHLPKDSQQRRQELQISGWSFAWESKGNSSRSGLLEQSDHGCIPTRTCE
jgi:hypothetical protein